MADPPIQSPTPAFQERAESSIIQAHIGEYAALTMKATYDMGFCTVVWGIIAGYVTLIVNMWPHMKQSSIIWISVIVIELLLIWISTLILDQYVSVLYIETELKPLVAREVANGDDFWRWERFVARNRGGNTPLLWEWGMSIGSGALILVALIWRLFLGWTRWDWQSLVSILLLYFLIKMARDIEATRKEWTRFNSDWEKSLATPRNLSDHPLEKTT
jgi:hypothetical protein